MSPEERTALQVQTDAVLAAIRRSVRAALLDHKRAGNPVASWEDARVVWIPPEEIPDFDDSDDEKTGEAHFPESLQPI